MNSNSNGIVWLNVCMAVGMCLCTFTGGLKVDLASLGIPIAFPAANILFALMTFPATDILAEVYGKREAQRTVWIGYFSQALTIAIIHLMIRLPGDTSNLEPFAQSGLYVFLASSLAYLAAQFWDVFIFHYIREKFTGRAHLWLRNNLSTMSSQLINSLIFISVVFGVHQLPQLLVGSIIVKFAAAVIDTPFVYLGCFLLRKGEEEQNQECKRITLINGSSYG